MANIPFPHKLALNRYMLSLFGADVHTANNDPFREATKGLTEESLEGRGEDGVYTYHAEIARRLTKGGWLTVEQLLDYDQNIARHTDHINRKREPKVEWKYFQYLALLFTEIYLDRWFRDASGLLSDLNAHLASFNDTLVEWQRGEKKKDKISPFTEDSLTKLAFWNATGSGKTLLMHVNILQFRHYLKKYGREKAYNRVVVLTPNEGLTRQHLDEFRQSDIAAAAFDKNLSASSFLSGQVIDVIDMNKLKEEGKKKTVSVDQFETNNLVLIDEGHRGARGDVWSDMRARLAEEGFTFEYSATLGQAVGGSATLADEYAKTILFDYSYRFFHADGFGKDYHILNINNLTDSKADHDKRHLYLTACLLTFYQQLRLHEERGGQLKAFAIDKPLWVFVGSRVTAVRKENSRNVSDVVDILLFLTEFLGSRTVSIANIAKLLSGNTGLLNPENRDIFAEAFPTLLALKLSADAVFDDVLKRVFNATVGGDLHVEYLKGGDGELALRLGTASDAFGVVNVGDAKAVYDLCEGKDKRMVLSEKEFSDSMFSSINNADSPITMLIGSKRFSEGWNSHRVSTMGLMHVGQSEGSEIIQLFGRGVRLRGFENCLKRSRAIHWATKDSELSWVPKDPSLYLLETLNVFGVKSDYMARFDEFLKGEGIKKPDDAQEFTIKTTRQLPTTPLIVVRVPEDRNFKREKKVEFGLPADFPSKRRVTLDWYPRIDARASDGVRISRHDTALHEGKLRDRHLAFMDLDAIWLELQRFKASRNWHNLGLSRQSIRDLLEKPDWYTLYIPKDRLDATDFGRVREWEEIAVALLKKFCDRFYAFKQDEFEAPLREYRELAPNDPNIVEEYKLLVDRSETSIIQKIEELESHIAAGKLTDFNLHGVGTAMWFDRHLYVPVMHLGKGVDPEAFRISPVALNEGERDFLEDLRRFHESKPAILAGKEVYLLRNQSKGRGIGFFEAGNFYPDFILWILDGGIQHVVFVDPKGILRCEGIDDPKLRFFETVKELEERMRREKRAFADRVRMTSFVVSNTALSDVRWWKPELATAEDFAKRHVLFQNDKKDNYVETLFERTFMVNVMEMA